MKDRQAHDTRTQRVARRKGIASTLKFSQTFLNFVIAAMAVWAAITAHLAFVEYQETNELADRNNRVAARNQLYDTEQFLAGREIGTPVLAALYVELPRDITPLESFQNRIHPLTEDPDVRAAKTVEEYFYAIFARHAKSPRDALWDSQKLYLHTENWLYHLQVAFDYFDEGIYSQGEWDSWAGWLDDVDAHPSLLAAIFNAHDSNYISAAFARELVDKLTASPDAKALIEAVYPEMLTPEWVDSLFSYNVF